MQVDSPPTPRTSGPEGLRIERVSLDRYREIQALNRILFGDDRVIFRLDRDDLRVLDGLGGSPSAQFTPKVLTRQSRLDLQIRPHQFFQGQTTGGLTLLYFTILSLTHL